MNPHYIYKRERVACVTAISMRGSHNRARSSVLAPSLISAVSSAASSKLRFLTGFVSSGVSYPSSNSSAWHRPWEELAKKKFETCVQENFDIPPPEGHDFGYGCTILASRGHAVVSICGPRGVEQPCEKLGDDLDTLVSTCASRDRYDDGLVPPGSIDYADWPYFAEAVLKLEYKSEELFSSTEVLKQIVT
ncbi:unnamed protein product [Calypogeia fissa]